jgi:1-phosphofructokinase family hexose kinase
MIYTVTLNPTLDRTLHYPRLVVGALNRATRARTDLSGKGVNVSLALSKFGLPSVMMGLAGGVMGRVLVEGLRERGYECDFLPVAGEARSNITVIDDAAGVTTKLNEPGPTVGDADLAAFAVRLVERVQRGDGCVFSGNLPPGAPAESYARLIATVIARGAWAALDSSGAALAPGCAAGPALLKPNAEEAEGLVGYALDHEDAWARAAAAILARGARRVLISLGSRGAVYADGAGVWHAQPPAITEVSAVGAGDSLLAAALWAWQGGREAAEIARWAAAAGTAAALEDGSAGPDPARVREVYAQVRVKQLW